MNAADILRYEELLRYELAMVEAEQSLYKFMQFMRPHKAAPDDPSRTSFIPARHLELLCDVMESLSRREIYGAIIVAPPRHGKTETCTISTNAWLAGKYPEWDIMTAAYGQSLARTFYLNVRNIMDSPRYRQLFPEFEITEANTEEIQNHLGKKLYFLGRRSPTNGRGGDFLLVDDPIKDDKDARSPVLRDDSWEWFTQTLLARRHHDKAPVMLTTVRWNEDDLVGRITDPSNPKYHKDFAAGWVVVNLPALAVDEDDPLGRKPGEALWPSRFGAEDLKKRRAANPTGFSALYQGNPTPPDGVFYKNDEIHTYLAADLPTDGLRYFAASDHAVSTAEHNDPSVLGVFAVDTRGTAYVLPDLVWKRIATDAAVEQMIRMMRRYSLLWWYAERGHISRAIGPFLKKRMEEERVYCPIVEDQPVVDKVQRAHSARARCAQGRILFPSEADWWPAAKEEMLKFPNGQRDDFCDFVSIIGMKLASHVAGFTATPDTTPEPGTWGALKAEFDAHEHGMRRADVHRGW